MSKIKDILLMIGGALSVFFYISNKSKDRKIEKHKDEAEQYKAEAELQGYIAESEREAKRTKDHISQHSESDIDRMLRDHNAYRD